MNFNDYFTGLLGKSVGVIGVGVSNKPLIRVLLEHGVNVNVRDKSPDNDTVAELEKLRPMGLELRLGNDYLSGLNEEVLFRTPGLHPDTPELKAAREKGSVLTSEMEAFFETCPCPVIAVTGSDGKTTTTTLIAEILKHAGFTVHLGGNIGKPLLAEVPDIKPSDYAVVELSSFQLMGMRKCAHIAVVTNISPNHLDYHRDMEEYTEAKKNIFMNQKQTDLLVLNADNAVTRGFDPLSGVQLCFFSRKEAPENGCFFDGKCIYFIENGERQSIIPYSEIALGGLHNIENLMAAFCATIKIARGDCCRETAQSFTGVRHRVEPVRTVHGVTFYNDSAASSPTRSIAGLMSFDKKVILIAGGYDKNIPYTPLGPVIREKVKSLVLTGDSAAKIKTAVLDADCGGQLPVIIEEPDFERAVLAAADAAESGDAVILSPASASFDQFKNFEDRARVFKEIVNKL